LFFPSGITGKGDTFAGWTWFTANSTSNTIPVPCAGGSAAVGEQAIRNGTNFEINFTGSPTTKFNFRWGTAGTAIALRRTFPGVSEGWAMVNWTVDPMPGFHAYVSQNHGATWRAIHSGYSFEVVDGDLDVVFVGNDGADSPGTENSGLHSVTITVTWPAEPGDPWLPNQDITVEALIPDAIKGPFQQAVVRVSRSGPTGSPTPTSPAIRDVIADSQ